jgi:hypothetical protein
MHLNIYTFVFNRPDLLERQYLSFKKNLIDKFTFNVVCDYQSSSPINDFIDLCEKYCLPFYRHPSLNSNPSENHGHCLDYVYNNLSNNDPHDYNLFLDHDIFLIKEGSLLEKIQGYDLIGLPQERKGVKYVWPGLFFFKKQNLTKYSFSFRPCFAINTQLDTGGGLWPILDKIAYLKTNVKYLNYDEDSNEGYDFEMHMDEMFLHFRNGSRWDNGYRINKNSKKINILNNILGDV